jgi:hypothetical protein
VSGSAEHCRGFAALALGLAVGLTAFAPAAAADPAPNWNGWYRITFQTDQ